ncbi:MAG: TetR family transcriptional regulator [Deltaproteobacteria bacterium]|nr:TetR family transcriptional regulator [Deltaproteobacteria bacterium]
MIKKSSGRRGRPPNTPERRAQLVEALMRVIARDGWAGAGTRAIAAEAGLAPGLVHYHFRNKHELLVALADELSRRGSARFAARRAGTSGTASLYAFLDANLARGEDEDTLAAACWAELGTLAAHDAPVRRAWRAVLDARRAVLRPLVAEATGWAAASRQVTDACAALDAAMEGYFVLSRSAPDLLPAGSAAASLRAMAAGLLAHGEDTHDRVVRRRARRR